MGRLQGKRALITGATSGIGLETAKQFLLEGAEVAITGRNLMALESAKQELGENVITILSDAAEASGQRRLAEELAAHWPKLDVLYINAGDVALLPVEAWTEARYDQMMNTNVKGPFFLVQALVPYLANPSSVILCASARVHAVAAGNTVYGASKAALLLLARALSSDLIGQGIRVNAVSPGVTETNIINKQGLSTEAKDAFRKKMSASLPVGRLGTPLDQAKAVVYLASDESSYVVGTELVVDGGETMSM